MGPIAVAIVATLAVVVTLPPDTTGPGVTCDEAYHVFEGKQLVTAWRWQGLAFFSADNARRNFPWTADGPPVQAPLGHWILGAFHHLFDPEPDNPSYLSLVAARFAPAICFGMLVLLVGVWTTSKEDALAGTVAAAAVALTPRVFAHAHLAALDTITTLFFVAALLAVCRAARRDTWWAFCAAGAVWGLALLVRLHALLLVPPIVVWLILRSRRRAVTPLVCWLTTGTLVFFLGWPWLWIDPVGHLWQYFVSGTARDPVQVFYFGTVWADRDVPWHYPWVMFLVTMPVALLVLAAVGVWACRPRRIADPQPPTSAATSPPINAQRIDAPKRAARGRRKGPSRGLPNKAGDKAASPAVRDVVCGAAFKANSDRQDVRLFGWQTDADYALLGFAGLLVMVVFSWPGTPVYDGVRLFLMVFPLAAVAVGVGARFLVDRAVWPPVGRPARIALLVLILLWPTIAVVRYHPLQLSYYNLLVGGLRGATSLGFEVTYWGDSVREPILAEAAARCGRRPVLLAPNLALFQAPAVASASPALGAAQVSVVGWDPARADSLADCRYMVVYRRRANLGQLGWVFKYGRVVEERQLAGQWVARLVQFDGPPGRVAAKR